MVKGCGANSRVDVQSSSCRSWLEDLGMGGSQDFGKIVGWGKCLFVINFYSCFWCQTKKKPRQRICGMRRKGVGAKL